MGICTIFKYLLVCVIISQKRSLVCSTNREPVKGESRESFNESSLALNNIKIITDGPSGLKENDFSLIGVERKGKVFTFTPKGNSKFLEVKYRDGIGFEVKRVWKNDPEKCKKEFPTKILYDYKYKYITVWFREDWYYKYMYDQFTTRFILESKKLPWKEQDQPEELKIITEEPLDSLGRRENDRTKYNVVRGDNIVYFDFAEGSKCIELKHRGEEVWNFNFEKSERQNPTNIVLNLHTQIITLLFKKFYLVYEYTDKGLEFKGRTDLHRPSEEDLVIATLDPSDPSDPSKTKENDTTKYEVKRIEERVEYEFRKGVKCVHLKYKGDKMWDYEEDQSKGFPRKIYFHLDTEIIFVEFESGVEVYRRSYNQFGRIPHKSPDYLSENLVKIVTSDDLEGSNAMENDRTKYQVKRLAYGCEFEIKEPAKCIEVKYEDVTLWKYEGNEGEVPSKITLNVHNEMIVIDFGEYYQDYKLKEGKWKVVFSTKQEKFDEMVQEGKGDSATPESTVVPEGGDSPVKREITKRERNTIICLMTFVFAVILSGLGVYFLIRK